MITDRTKKDLYMLVENLVRRDFKLSNPSDKPKKDRNGKPKYNEYFLSEETREALEMYATAISKNSTVDDEKRVDVYFRGIKLNHPSWLIEGVFDA